MLSYFKNRKRLKAQASEIYGRVVAQARRREFYEGLGVPDTPEGRLEAIVAHLVLVIRRLRRDGEAGNRLARAMAEAFVTDMDDCMREMGVGDLTVPRKVKKAAGALWDRAHAYGPALDGGEHEALARLLATHVTAGEMDKAQRFAGYMLEADSVLGRQPSEALLGEGAQFPVPPI